MKVVLCDICRKYSEHDLTTIHLAIELSKFIESPDANTSTRVDKYENKRERSISYCRDCYKETDIDTILVKSMGILKEQP